MTDTVLETLINVKKVTKNVKLPNADKIILMLHKCIIAHREKF